MAADDEARAERARNLGSLILRSERDGDTHVVELLGELDIAGAPRLEEEFLRVEADATPPRSSSTCAAWSSSTRPASACC